jgi:low affinity Fe/Cu permease
VKTLLANALHPTLGAPDTQAIHAKLDELLRAQGDAKTGLITWDNKELEQIEAPQEGANKIKCHLPSYHGWTKVRQLAA